MTIRIRDSQTTNLANLTADLLHPTPRYLLPMAGKQFPISQ